MTDAPVIPTAAPHGPAGAFQAEGQEHAVASARPHPPVLHVVGGIDRHEIRWMNVEVPAGAVTLRGRLMLPPAPRGMVLLADGSRSPEGRRVAGVVNAARYATLLLELRGPADPPDAVELLDPDLQAERVLHAVRWMDTAPQVPRLRLGLLGTSTEAAAALIAAARAPLTIRAVVIYAGRPDLAGDRLRDVSAPTLLIVGGEDRVGEIRNREALGALRCKARIAVVPGASPQFDEPRPLGQAARLAAAWFDEHLAEPSTSSGRPSGAEPSACAT